MLHERPPDATVSIFEQTVAIAYPVRLRYTDEDRVFEVLDGMVGTR
jgi:hypothetical protein